MTSTSSSTRLDHLYYAHIAGGVSREAFEAALAAHPGGAAGAARVEAHGASRWMYFGRDCVAQYHNWDDGPTLGTWDLETVRADRLRKRAWRAARHAEWEPLHEADKADIVKALYEGRQVLYNDGPQGGSFSLNETSPRVSARGVYNIIRGRKSSMEELWDWMSQNGAEHFWPMWTPQPFSIAPDTEPPVPWGSAKCRRNPVEFDWELAG